jgi:putative endonuclease
VTKARQELGRYGEQLACDELARRGYTVVERRYRKRAGELDIVAKHRDYVVFIEVKARRDRSFGDPEEAVTLQKQQKMVQMATDFLVRNHLQEVPCRFDVVAINTETDPPTISILEDAFRPGW